MLSRRPITVDIDELAMALDTPGVDHYFDRLHGKVILIDENGTDSRVQQWLLERPEDFLPIDPLSPTEFLAIMQAFLPEIDDPHLFQLLNNALKGRRPHKAFHYWLMGYPQQLSQWHAFHREHLHERALDWLAAHVLEPT